MSLGKTLHKYLIIRLHKFDKNTLVFPNTSGKYFDLLPALPLNNCIIKFKGIYQPEKLMSNGSSRNDDVAQTK
jgi:hypothetical protein